MAGRQASGFLCPKCKDDTLQEIEGEDVVHILALKCKLCGHRWAVESAHETRAWLSSTGKVKPV